MKRFRKVLLALTALLGIVIVGGIWLINSALNVASDVVDSTFAGAQKVQAVAQREIVGGEQNAQKNAKAADVDAEKASDVANKTASVKNAPKTSDDEDTPALTAATATNSADKPATKANSKNNAKNTPKSYEESLADFGNILNLFLNDGDDDSGIADVLKSGDKGKETDGDKTAENKPGGNKDDDSLTDLIPGANSPTVKGWMAGKYKGKEAQALDDALEDPKFLRLIFFLGGGM